MHDRKLLTIIFSAADTLFKIFDNMKKKDDHFKPGFIITLHSFGRDLKWNPHVHILLADGYTDNANVFHSMNFISYAALRKRWMIPLLYSLKHAIKRTFASLYKNFMNLFYIDCNDGFYIYAPP